MTTIIKGDRIEITCGICGRPAVQRCYCAFDTSREWCTEHLCSCGDHVEWLRPRLEVVK